MLDDDSDWNDLDEEAEQDENREASDDYDAGEEEHKYDGGEEEHEGLEGFLDYIEEYQVFFRLCAYKHFLFVLF